MALDAGPHHGLVIFPGGLHAGGHGAYVRGREPALEPATVPHQTGEHFQVSAGVAAGLLQRGSELRAPGLGGLELQRLQRVSLGPHVLDLGSGPLAVVHVAVERDNP